MKVLPLAIQVHLVSTRAAVNRVAVTLNIDLVIVISSVNVTIIALYIYMIVTRFTLDRVAVTGRVNEVVSLSTVDRIVIASHRSKCKKKCRSAKPIGQAR